MSLISDKKRAFEGDVVELLVDLPKPNLKRGQRGVVITAFDEPCDAYDLEMVDESGNLTGFAYSVKGDQFTNLSRNAFVKAMEAVERVDLLTAEKELRTATDLRPDYIASFVSSVLASVPEVEERTVFEDDISYLIPLLRLAIRVDPDYELAQNNLAVAFLNFGAGKARKKNYQEAVELFYSALALKPDPETLSLIRTNLVMAFTTLGREAFENDKVEEGFGYVRTAFLVRQDETTRRNLGIAYGNLGVFFIRSRRFDLALQQFERAEDSGVVLPEYVNDRGACLALSGRITEALGEFERVLEIDPSNGTAQQNLLTLRRIESTVTRQLSTTELEAFLNSISTQTSELIDFDGVGPRTLNWRVPKVSARGFAPVG